MLAVAAQVVAAVKSGKLEHVFVIGGCDGAEKGRGYYAQLAAALPKSTMVLTLGCAKCEFFLGFFCVRVGLCVCLSLLRTHFDAAARTIITRAPPTHH